MYLTYICCKSKNYQLSPQSVLNSQSFLKFIWFVLVTQTTVLMPLAKLKKSNDVQFQTLNQRIADICETIVFSNKTR